MVNTTCHFLCREDDAFCFPQWNQRCRPTFQTTQNLGEIWHFLGLTPGDVPSFSGCFLGYSGLRMGIWYVYIYIYIWCIEIYIDHELRTICRPLQACLLVFGCPSNYSNHRGTHRIVFIYTFLPFASTLHVISVEQIELDCHTWEIRYVWVTAGLKICNIAAYLCYVVK